MTDMKLNEHWQPIPTAKGEALVTDVEQLLQAIQLEAMTQEGELFYDRSYGWSLYDFIQVEQDELYELEIKERVKIKLARYAEVNMETLEVTVSLQKDALLVLLNFRLIGSHEIYTVSVSLSRVNVEVETSD